MARIEPYFNVIINAENEIMIALKTKAGDPVEPKLFFDGFNALLHRDAKNDILLTNMKEAAIRGIQNVASVMVTETDSGQLTFKKNKKGEIKFREKVKQVYDVPIIPCEKLPEVKIENPEALKKKDVGEQPTGIVKFSFFGWLFDRIVITLCWMVMFAVIGLVLQQLADKNVYDVTSNNEAGKAILAEHSVKYTPEFEFAIFWTTIYRTGDGVFVLESDIPELEAKQYSSIPDAKSKEYGFTAEYSDWDATGWQILIAIMLGVSFLGSFLPFEVFNTFGKAVESMQ